MNKQNQILSLMSELVSFKTLNNQNSDEFERAFSFVRGFMISGGNVKFERFESKKKESMLITPANQEGKLKALMTCHMDVVPTDNEENFKTKIEDGKIWGRGVQDIKGFLAIMMQVLKDISEKNDAAPIGLLVTSDEESGGFDGVEFVLDELEKRGELPELGIVPDDGVNFDICTAEKGVYFFRIESEGDYAHSSRPFEGQNAVEMILEFYKDLESQIEWATKKNDWKPTISMNKISGGVAINTLPEHSEATFDLRHTEDFGLKKIDKIVRDTVKKYPNLKIDVFLPGEAFYTDPENESVQNYKKISEEVLGRKVNFIKNEGASDARHFTYKNIPAIMSQANCGGNHTEREWLDIESIGQFYEIQMKFLEGLI